MPLDWMRCPSDPLPWIALREPLLQVLFTPWLLLPLTAVPLWFVLRSARLPGMQCSVVVGACSVVLMGLYTPQATQWLSTWLDTQRPASASLPLRAGQPPVLVLVGRGSAIAESTSAVAADLFHALAASAVYVSGDERATAEKVVAGGVPADRVAGDSCARTTWENATVTKAWLQRNHPGAPVLLITDRWQLPRAAHAYARQDLVVEAIAVAPSLSQAERNRLALRETAATLVYRLQGRM